MEPAVWLEQNPLPAKTFFNNASLMSPVEMPFKYNQGSAAETRGDFRT